MNKTVDIIGTELKWTQPNGWKMNYVLQADEQVLAVLEFESSFRSRAMAQSGDGQWIFDQKGFWQTNITVENTYGTELAAFKKNVWKGGGTLELANGRKITAKTNFMQSELELIDEQGTLLLHYQIGGFVHASATLTATPQAAALAELPWLIIFGWYLVVILRRDSAAAAAA